MKRWLGIGIPVAAAGAVLVEIARRKFDMDHPSFAYCLLMLLVFVSLIAIVRSGLDRSIPMSRTVRLVRVVGGGLWALMILLGMLAQVWSALR
jgi:hypothetical protein